MVHVVHLGTAQLLNAAKLVHGGHVLLDGVGNAVLGQQLADRAGLTLGTRAVVAEHIEDEGVVAEAHLVQLGDHPSGLEVGMLGEAGEHLHEPLLEGSLAIGDAVPAGQGVRARRQLGVLWNPTQRLLAGEDLLAQHVPALVELGFVLVGPFGEDVVRPMGCARCPVHQEGLVWRVGLVFVQPGDGVVGQVGGQVILGIVRRLDRVGVLNEPRLPLRSFTGKEAIEILEAVSRGPTVERTHGSCLSGGRVVPLAEGCGAVAIVLQHFRNGGRGLGDDANISVPIHRTFGDGARADAVLVAPRQQGRAGWRTDRRGGEGVVGNPLSCKLAESGCVNEAAEGVRHAIAHIIHKHDEDVGGIGSQVLHIDPALVRRLFQRRPSNTGRRRWLKW